MLGEPLLLGLLLAPSWATAGLVLAVCGAFLARHPLKIAVTDHLRGGIHSRTRAARRLASAYAAIALAGAAWSAPRVEASAWLPLLLALPLAAVQFAYDVRLRGRGVFPELLGSAAPGSVAASLLLAGGWSGSIAFAAWLALALKGLGSVLYVRARLRRDRGQTAARWPTLVSHGIAVAAAGGGAWAGLLPWLGVAAFVLLLGRAAHGLSRWHRPVRPQTIGVREMAWGFLMVGALVFGFGAGW